MSWSQQDQYATTEVRNYLGTFHTLTSPLGEHELGWRAYFGLTYEENFPLATLRERYHDRRPT